MAGLITQSHRDGFKVFSKGEGAEYWSIVRACMLTDFDQEGLTRNFPAEPLITIRRPDGPEFAVQPMAYCNPKRLVLRAEVAGRRYVVKRAFMGTPGFNRLLPGVAGLTYFTRIMNIVDTAVRAGCDRTQEYYLVAERFIAPFRREVWTLMEYIEGTPLGGLPDMTAYSAELAAAAAELIRHGLTMDDLSPYNFLLSDGKIRAIDISCRPFARLQAVKMAMKIEARYGLRIPMPGLVNGLLRSFLSARYRLRGGVGEKV